MKDFNGSVVIIDPAKFTNSSKKPVFHSFYLNELGYSPMYVYQYRVDNIKEYYSQGTENWVKGAINRAFNGQSLKTKKISQALVDSGSIGVFLLSDLQSYNPEVLSKLKSGVDYILIPNYRGKIGYTRDKYGVLHFFGTGSHNFYTL